jgi:hypothetical protein
LERDGPSHAQTCELKTPRARDCLSKSAGPGTAVLLKESCQGVNRETITAHTLAKDAFSPALCVPSSGYVSAPVLP